MDIWTYGRTSSSVVVATVPIALSYKLHKIWLTSHVLLTSQNRGDMLKYRNSSKLFKLVKCMHLVMHMGVMIEVGYGDSGTHLGFLKMRPYF